MLTFILVICYLQLNTEGFNGYAPLNYVLKNSNNTNCGGLKYNNINKEISSTGTYDGIILKSNTVTKPLINPITIFSPVGDGIKLSQPLGNEMYPTVDGKADSPKHLFSFAYNNVSPDCCGHSNLSSDMGCVCYSQEQLKRINTRGSNVKDYMPYSEI